MFMESSTSDVEFVSWESDWLSGAIATLGARLLHTTQLRQRLRIPSREHKDSCCLTTKSEAGTNWTRPSAEAISGALLAAQAAPPATSVLTMYEYLIIGRSPHPLLVSCQTTADCCIVTASPDKPTAA